MKAGRRPWHKGRAPLTNLDRILLRLFRRHSTNIAKSMAKNNPLFTRMKELNK